MASASATSAPLQRLHVRITANGADCHDLAIAVDNRFDAERTPLFPPYSDFYAYGGIYRSIELEELRPCASSASVQTLDLDAARVGRRSAWGATCPIELTLPACL